MAAQHQDGFINDVREEDIIGELKTLESSPVYLTAPAYRGNEEKWPNHQIPFIEFHLNYLKAHPGLNPYHYISNLRLTLKK